jgi:HD-GYP domain-containing protein (c-di-GMP phosphodiesterase class II)
VFDRLALPDDLVDCRGNVVAPRGFVLSPEAIAETAQRAPAFPRRALEATPLSDDVVAPLEEPAYRTLFHGQGVRADVARVLLAVRLPDALVDELVAARRSAPAVYVHALATAAIAARMLTIAVGPAPGVPELVAAALLHDVGMLHVPPGIRAQVVRLGDEEAGRIAAHTLVGAFHLATLLGNHPSVTAARTHHWRCGQGYPGLAAPPPRSVEVVAVASAFAALTHPRPFRSGPYTARGAADVLVAETILGHADTNTVKLLVHALRGGTGEFRAMHLGHEREGHAPAVNRHAPVAAPAKNYV